MSLQPAREAASAASTALLVFCIAVAAFLPPISERVLPAGPLVIVVLALAIAASFFLHLYFVGIAARRLGRSAALWVLLALVTMPLGSIVGLILYEWAVRQEGAAKDPTPPRAV